MIKFFRKIRQNMLTENKFSKYLLYAIGEIILVVIGILIALGLNNWKDNKATANIEYGYMQNLKEDLNIDIELYNDYLEKNAEIFKIIELMVFQLSQDNFQSTSDESAFNSRIMTTKWNRVRPVERTFEQMKSSGQLKIISKQIVSDNISDYYNSIFELETYNEALLLWLENYIKLMGKVYNGQVLLEILKTKNKVSTENSAIITEDRETINELITSAQYIYGAISLSEKLVINRKEKAKNLIQEIDKNYNKK
ncbi:DUF6090 family protein [Mesoflavibacter sp. CH_XMU1422-2]|uniref:DUF6090 family protein n=1 Tax=Mesoflavibacter sp. CH_XMU1422-2 TaxID=3107770 RepID=UPI00300B74E0